MALRELFVKMGFEVDEKPIKDFEASITSLKAGVLGLSSTIGGALGSIYGIVHTTAEAGREASLLSQKTGIAVESIQKLEHAAKMSGVQTENLAFGLKFLSRNSYDAIHGSNELRLAFRRAGLSMSELRTLKTDQLLLRLSDAFKGMKDPQEKVALSMKLFGRSGNEMIPFLAKGSKEINQLGIEAEKYNLILSEKSVNASKKFILSIKEVKEIIIGIKRVVGVSFLEPLTKIIEQVKKWLEQNNKLIKQNLTGVIKALIFYMEAAFKIIKALVGSIMTLINTFSSAEEVVKKFIATLGIMSGFAILFGIGKLVQGFYNITKAIRVMGAEALLAQVKAFAIPILIGAGLGLLALAIEDIVTFFKNPEADTFTKDIIKAVNPLFDWFNKKLTELEEHLDRIFSKIPGFNFIKDLIMNKDPDNEAKSQTVLERNGIRLPKKNESGGFITDIAGTISEVASGVSGSNSNINPITSPLGNTTNKNSSVNNISTTVNISVPEGTPKTDILKSIENGVSNGIEPLIRQSMRTSAVGASY